MTSLGRKSATVRIDDGLHDDESETPGGALLGPRARAGGGSASARVGAEGQVVIDVDT